MGTAGGEKESDIDYQHELNPAQLRAVEKIDGPQLVIAGAGTGKTRTLVYRVAYLVQQGVDPESILLLTFTRKAAQEMMHRASQILDPRCSMVAGGTFHSFGNSVLRRYANRIGYSSNFTIVDRSDAQDIINMLRTELGFHKKDKRFPRKQALLNVISRSVNTGLSFGEILFEDYPKFCPEAENIIKLSEEYTAYKRSKSIMDYDDLLVHLRNLLFDNPDIRASLSRTYHYIMVDEYQDTNRLQAEIARLLASEHQNILVVGDDSQSIYSFRGANFRNIMDFPKLFPNCTITTLEQNYRSTQPILSLTNAIIENAREKFSKKLFSDIPGNRKPFYARPESEGQEAEFVRRRINDLVKDGVPLSDIAVLFRAGWHSNELEIELAGNHIPFVKYGGIKFVESAHVKDVLAFLRITFNPSDVIAWYRALPLLEGVGQATARRIVREAVDAGRGHQVLLSPEFSGKRYSEGLQNLHGILDRIALPAITVPEKVAMVADYYVPLLERNYDDPEKRLNDLSSLIQIAERYRSLERLLTDLSLEPPEQHQIGANPASGDEERLVLSTIHSAKGLEWNTVFLIHLVDGYLPSRYAFFNQESLEEERRLFYVAATRAKRNLFLIAPKLESRHIAFFDSGAPSRFIFEIQKLSQLMAKCRAS